MGKDFPYSRKIPQQSQNGQAKKQQKNGILIEP